MKQISLYQVGVYASVLFSAKYGPVALVTPENIVFYIQMSQNPDLTRNDPYCANLAKNGFVAIQYCTCVGGLNP